MSILWRAEHATGHIRALASGLWFSAADVRERQSSLRSQELMRRLSLVCPLYARAFAAVAASAAVALCGMGCGRKVGENDCRQVADHLGEVWAAEAKKEATDGPGKEKAEEVIRQEGERLKQDWAEDCKKDLIGKRVESKELSCLLATKTMADIQKCAQE
jgi:hypothetical protein